MDEQLVQLASGYIAMNGIVTAAVRLGAVGAMQAQCVIGDVLPLLADLIATDLPPRARLESFVPLIDIASARQEQANLRLFAN
jgi:urease accessory protein